MWVVTKCLFYLLHYILEIGQTFGMYLLVLLYNRNGYFVILIGMR